MKKLLLHLAVTMVLLTACKTKTTSENSTETISATSIPDSVRTKAVLTISDTLFYKFSINDVNGSTYTITFKAQEIGGTTEPYQITKGNNTIFYILRNGATDFILDIYARKGTGSQDHWMDTIHINSTPDLEYVRGCVLTPQPPNNPLNSEKLIPPTRINGPILKVIPQPDRVTASYIHVSAN